MCSIKIANGQHWQHCFHPAPAVRLAAAAGLQLPSGFTVPANARLQLQRIDNQTFQPLEFVPLVTLPAGYAGLLYLTTFATQTIPAGNNCEATMRLEIFWDQNCL